MTKEIVHVCVLPRDRAPARPRWRPAPACGGRIMWVCGHECVCVCILGWCIHIYIHHIHKPPPPKKTPTLATAAWPERPYPFLHTYTSTSTHPCGRGVAWKTLTSSSVGPFHPMPRSSAAPNSSTGTAWNKGCNVGGVGGWVLGFIWGGGGGRGGMGVWVWWLCLSICLSVCLD